MMALRLVAMLLTAAAAHDDHSIGRTASPIRQRKQQQLPLMLAQRPPGPPALLAAARVPSARVPSEDRGPIALLLLLYTLQGIPMGLGAAIPMLMLERGVSTMEQAVFSTVALPFAIKLLWAPLVDSIYSATFGRRKTWIVPMQGTIGAMMILAGSRVDALLGPVGGSHAVNVRALTYLFLAFYFLAATQDIAVDGLALTVLSPQNRELGATCNAVGQTFGTFLAYVVFILLHARGLTTLGQFMQLWGCVFIGSIGAVVLLAKKDEYARAAGDSIRLTFRRVIHTYAEMGSVLMLPSVRAVR